MPTLILLFLLLVSVPGWAATRLVVASGGATTGDCTSTACTVARAITQAVPGDTITLANGTYSGSTTINCNSGAQDGTSLNRIILKATNERQAFLSGSGAAPLQVYNCDFWTIEGLHLANVDNGASIAGSPGSVMFLQSSNNLILRRLLVHHPNRYGNTHAIEFYIADNNLVEENEVYDFHRHGIIVQTGTGNIYRRNYVNSRGFVDLPGCNNSLDGVHGWCSNQPAGDSGLMAYPAAFTIMENNISEGNGFGFDMNARFGNSEGNKYYGNIANDNYYGFSLTAGSDNLNVSDMPLNSIWENNVSISGSTTNRAFRGRSTKNLMAHNNTVIGAGAEAGWMLDLDPNGLGDSLPTSFATNLLVTKAASSSAYGISVTDQSSWSLDYVNVFNFTNNTPALNDSHITHSSTTDPALGACYAWLPDASPMKGAGLSGADVGANILYRYQDGALSSTPLWDTTTGAFPCGAVVTGVNDNAANNCTGIPARFHINQGGCSFPASYGGASTTPDYRLLSTSPLRNAALCLASVPLDIVGYTRGSACDMGAYEFQSGGAIGLVAKYLFSEGSGVMVADSSGLGHTGTFAPDGGWTTGLIGPYAGLFDGTRYVSISGVSELRPTTEATVGVWFKATTVDVGGSALVALPNDGLMPYLTSLGRAACQLYDELGHFVTITSSGSYLDDTRHFLNCSYLKGDGLYLRVDHTQVGFTSLSTNISYNIGGTNNVELGRSSGNTTNLNFVGSLDHITLKDTACDTACDLMLFQEGMSQRRIMVMGVR